jgi:hypothetical protein
MPSTKPWERQKGETEKAYEAFVLFRDAGPGRTLIAVARELHKSYTLIRRWNDTWNWSERVRLYDVDVEKAARAQAVKDRKDMIARHTKLALDVQKKAEEALKALKVSDMAPKDIKEYIKMATDLERLNRDIVEAENVVGRKENNLLAALQDSTGEDIDTDDLPEIQ